MRLPTEVVMVSEMRTRHLVEGARTADGDRPETPVAHHGLTRQQLLFGGGGLAVGAGLGAGAGLGIGRASAPESAGAGPDDLATADAGFLRGAPVPATGTHQAGIDLPARPQARGLTSVWRLDPLHDGNAGDARDWLRTLLDTLGQRILTITAGAPTTINGRRFDPTDTVPDGPGDLTLTIGLGPDAVRTIGADLPGADALPRFDGDDRLDYAHLGGDLLVLAYAADAAVVAGATAALLGDLDGVRPLRSQAGYRAAGEAGIARNPLGYHDGVIVPHGDTELTENVWLPDGPAAGGTLCVVRQFRLDVARFRALSAARRDAIIGRQRVSGAPLSGGQITDQGDMLARSQRGDYLIPNGSHMRAAHPAFTGSLLMLRRGYSYQNGATGRTSTARAGASRGAVLDDADDQGLLFTCFMRNLDTFTSTMLRMQGDSPNSVESTGTRDRLLTYAHAVASGSWLLPPGFDAGRPFCTSLFG